MLRNPWKDKPFVSYEQQINVYNKVEWERNSTQHWIQHMNWFHYHLTSIFHAVLEWIGQFNRIQLAWGLHSRTVYFGNTLPNAATLQSGLGAFFLNTNISEVTNKGKALKDVSLYQVLKGLSMKEEQESCYREDT